jgi:hypothetical protein
MILSPLLPELLLLPIIFCDFAVTELLLLPIIVSFVVRVTTAMNKIATIN